MQAGVQTIALQGIDLQVVRRGTGLPLLLLHGGDGPQSHLPFFQRLTEQFDVIAPTHPGFASSPIPEHFDALEDLVYLYLDLLDALDVRNVVLMGFAMGGWVAAELAVRNTTRLAQPDLAAMTDVQVTVLAADRIAHAMYTWDPYMHNPKLRYWLHRITVPTLLIWGASDGVVPVAYAEAYRAMIPGAQLVIIPEAGHLPHVEQPELLLQHVLSFTAR